jgi:23S rRNA (uracil1939-C5)-methyltransferase
MKHKPEKVRAKIHNLGYCSEGIGKITEGPKKDMTVFIDNTAPGDYLEAETFSHKKNYVRAMLKQLIQEGPFRVTPKCPLARVCGGCQWQHIDYETQLKTKASLLRENLARIGGITEDVVKETIASPEIWNYRAKVQFPLDQTKKSKRLLIGYYKKKSHDIVNIKYCPVQNELFDRIINATRELWGKYNLKGYDEKARKGYLRHIILRMSQARSEVLITFVINSKSVDQHLSKLTSDLMKQFPEIKGVTANFNRKDTNVILGETSELIAGDPYIIEEIGFKKYRISDRSFFQVNPHATKVAFDVIRKLVEEGGYRENLLDVYAGGCAISIYLRDLFKKVVAIESSDTSAEDAAANIALNDLTEMYYIHRPAREALESMQDIKDFDWIILDPPRSGCEREVLDICSQRGSVNIIYVSCNPATLARDISILKENGFVLKSVQPVDMFCHTYHVESISLLVKNVC